MKIKITEITDWEEDNCMIAGDASHEGDRAVQRLLEEERTNKIDNGNAEGLPFVCEAENEDDALEKYNAEFCEYDYLKAAACDWEEVEESTTLIEKDSISKKFHVVLSSVVGGVGKYKVDVKNLENGKKAEMWYDDEDLAREDAANFINDITTIGYDVM